MEKDFTVIFDFDGTLADTIALVGRIYNEHAEQFGALPIDLAHLPEYRRLGYKGAMKKAHIRWTVLPRLVLFISKEMKAHMAEVKPYKGIVPMLEKFKKQGISTGVLTSNNEQLVREFFAAHNFPEFDFVISEKTMFGKEKALKKIVKRNKLDRERTIYVGDEPRDITGSQKAGLKVVGVTWGVGGKEAFEATPPDISVDAPAQLQETVLQLAKK